MILCIDATTAEVVRMGVSIQQNAALVAWKTYKTRDVLAAAVRELKRNKKTLKDLSGVAVVPGPGPFSRVRAGVTLANTLSFASGVPLWALRSGKLRHVRGVLAPHYGKPPNITKPRHKQNSSDRGRSGFVAPL